MARYRMTAKRKIALRKAQLASAAKRRGHHQRQVQQARTKRNLTLSRAGFNPRKRSRAIKAYHRDLNTLRVKNLGKKSRSQSRQNQIRRARAVGRTAIVAGSVYAQYNVATGGRAFQGHKQIARTIHKAPAAYARGFKRGYSQSRARNAATRRNMSRTNFNRATAHRVPQKALTGTRTKTYTTTRRRVRGY